MKFRTQGHCVYKNEYHLILVTKYRRKIFDDGVFKYMMECLKEFHEHCPEIEIMEANHDRDHVHFMISIAPKYAVSEVVRKIKLNTQRHLKTKYKYIQESYYGIGGIWSDGYFSSTVGLNEEVIRRYIEHQGEQDQGRAQLELG